MSIMIGELPHTGSSFTMADPEVFRPVGRPSIFSQQVAQRIIEGLVDGKSLRSLCLEDDMPTITTVVRWLADPRYAEFCAQYTRARMIQADTLADEVLHIADTEHPGVKIKTTITGEGDEARTVTERIEGDMTEHRKIQMDARKWFAGKLAPQKYGAKIATEITGSDGGPVQHSVGGRLKLYLPDNGRRPDQSA